MTRAEAIHILDNVARTLDIFTLLSADGDKDDKIKKDILIQNQYKLLELAQATLLASKDGQDNE